jgi:hypothetical protein
MSGLLTPALSTTGCIFTGSELVNPSCPALRAKDVALDFLAQVQRLLLRPLRLEEKEED